MATVKLVFSQSPIATPGPVRLVFGDDGGTPVIPNVTLQGGGRITGLRLRIGLRTGVLLSGGGRITGLRLRVGVQYSINVDRPLARDTRTGWQAAQHLRTSQQQRFEQAQPASAALQTAWQDAAHRGAVLQTQWQQTRSIASAVQQIVQQARPVAAAPTGQRFEQAARLRADTLQRLQQARPVAKAPAAQRFEDATRLRHLVHNAFDEARHAQAAVLGSIGHGMPLSRVIVGVYQPARKPPPGMWVVPPPPPPEPCYLPELPARLVFDTPWSSNPALVFVCERHTPPGPGPDPDPATYIIPVLEVYVSLHSLNAVLLPSLEPVALLDATIESDDGSFGWALSASGPEHLLDQLAPASGLPARVRVTIDGIDWVFAIERISRTRRFGQHRASIQGRSVTALLGNPYMPEQTWLNSADITAQQAVEQALQYTGTTLAWGIDDWLLPPGAWSHTGTPLAAALRVAESVGAVLRSHRTDAQLIYAPRYPALPWAWPTATAHVQMPAAIITTDSLEPDPRPAYNAVYVSGMSQGVLGHVKRTGTAGDLLAPQVTDALITQEVAARQRGSAVLGAAGPKLTQTMTVPLLTGGTNPGLIAPGYLLQVDDIGHTWRGLVRGIRISASLPTVRQTITVERTA